MKQKLWTAAAALIIIIATALITAHLTETSSSTEQTGQAKRAPAAATLTEPQAQAALLDTTDLPGWTSDQIQDDDTDLAGFDVAPADCATAVASLDTVSDQWDHSPTHAETAYQAITSGGATARLKEEVAHDQSRQPRSLVEHLEQLIEKCPTYVFSAGGLDYPGTIHARDFGQGKTGVGLTQTWNLPTSAGGGTMTVRFAYLIQGHSLAVVTLTTTDPAAISDADFSAIVTKASHKLGKAAH